MTDFEKWREAEDANLDLYNFPEEELKKAYLAGQASAEQRVKELEQNWVSECAAHNLCVEDYKCLQAQVAELTRERDELIGRPIPLTEWQKMEAELAALKAQVGKPSYPAASYEAYKEHKRKQLESVGFLKSPLRDTTPSTPAAERRVPDWQPIETAPKDGNRLVVVETDGGWWIGRLDRDKKGNWIHDGEPTFCHSYYFNPSKWMPLPAAPAPKGEEE